MFIRWFGLVFILLIGVAPLALGIIALVDSTRRPDDEWARARQNKTLWVVLIAVGFVLCAVGLVIDLVYLLSIRPQLDRVAARPGVAVAQVAAVAPVAPQPGWYPDPHARHELRWFDGLRWTEHVSDGGVTATEPVA
ncbi:MAG TPA: DUF2516 family protein [Acidimicrobiia bacterium]